MNNKDSVSKVNKSLKNKVDTGSLGSLQVDKNTYAFRIVGKELIVNIVGEKWK